MGMFDYMICEYPIDAPVTIKEWQTKDCQDSPYLERFKISPDGKLWHEYKEYELSEDEKSPLGFYQKAVVTEWRECADFRGEVVFYGNEYIDGKNDYKRWWEYSALFENGKLKSIKRISP